jgi:hypothetical protein
VKPLEKCIEGLRQQLERHLRKGLKEYPTRTVMLQMELDISSFEFRE